MHYIVKQKNLIFNKKKRQFYSLKPQPREGNSSTHKNRISVTRFLVFEDYFNQCPMPNGILLNPNKCVFGKTDNKLWEYIISKSSVRADSGKVKTLRTSKIRSFQTLQNKLQGLTKGKKIHV